MNRVTANPDSCLLALADHAIDDIADYEAYESFDKTATEAYEDIEFIMPKIDPEELVHLIAGDIARVMYPMKEPAPQRKTWTVKGHKIGQEIKYNIRKNVRCNTKTRKLRWKPVMRFQ